MKKMKKILAFVLAMAMVLGMSVTAFADEPTNGGGSTPSVNKPLPTDKKMATVLNVETGATVTAYQIVKANYDDHGFTGYEEVLANSIADKVGFQPTPTEITTLAGKTSELTTGEGKKAAVSMKGTANKDDEGKETGFSTYTAELEAGYWMVLVTGTVNEVYNPMLVGIYYTTQGSGSDNTLADPDEVNADGNWTLISPPAYAKSTAPTIDKKVVGSTAPKADGTTIDHNTAKDGGDDVAVGDTVKFEIETAIPSYSEQYKKVFVQINDTLSGGLKLEDASKVIVYVGEKVEADKVTKSETIDTDAENETYKLEVGTDGKSLKITFDSDYALVNSGKKVYVTYEAKLIEEGMNYNFNPNTNKVELKYTNDPSKTTEQDTKKTDDETYTYTFSIDAELYGPKDDSKPWNKVTNELIKGEMIKQEQEDGTTKEVFAPLGNAEFTLTNKETGKVYTASSNTTGNVGYLSFKGLDAGEYTLVETKAPSGYSLNKEEISVKIEAEYDDDGKLKDYSIIFDGVRKVTHTATYNATSTTSKTEITNISTKYFNNGEEITLEEAEALKKILNTKLSSLPSTGGIGTTIFTIGGCAIMIIAAGLFFASRRKSSK